uniref:ArfGAP with FG repeats 2 n=1 Tax=Bos indicus x Bos taurus TaxID=30522 RepID=A0A4W2FS90_BOBOX
MVMAAKKGPGPGGGVKAEAEAASEVWCRRVRELGGCSQAGNRHCFECAQRGVTYVDITVGSFVCTTCSGLLRGLNPPHRVKSISMTTFTEPEVLFLQARGNEVCRKIWLGLFDARTSLIPDSRDPQKVKEFLQEKYERKDGMSPQTKSRGPLTPKAAPPPPSRAPSQKASPPAHFWGILCRLSQLLPPTPASLSVSLGRPSPGALNLLPPPRSRKPVLICWLTLVETPLLLPRWHQLLLHSQPLGAKRLPMGALPTSMPSVVAPALLHLEAFLQLAKPRSRPSRRPQGAARELHLVPLLSHLLVSPTASQMWAVSWGRGHQLEASPAASLGWLARSPRSSRPPLAEAAAQGLLLEPSTLSPHLLLTPSCLPPTLSSPMAWPQDLPSETWDPPSWDRGH